MDGVHTNGAITERLLRSFGVRRGKWGMVVIGFDSGILREQISDAVPIAEGRNNLL
jgi:hypothetical protein